MTAVPPCASRCGRSGSYPISVNPAVSPVAFLEIVRDEQDRFAGGSPEIEELVLHQVAGLDVQRGEGLVHEEDGRIDDERLRELRALAHAAGELVRVVVDEGCEADPGDPFVDAICVAAAAETEW
jgi:hypothetical protein